MLSMQRPPANLPCCPKCNWRMSNADLIPGMTFMSGRAFVCDRCGNAEFIAEGNDASMDIARAG